MLYNMINEAGEELPFKPNNVRKDLDFCIMPSIVYNDPTDFILNCINDREKFICDMFIFYYDSMNPRRYPLEPKVFTPAEFSVKHKVWDSSKELLHIALPDEFAESLEYCSAYVITYTKTNNHIGNAKFFTIEDSMYGWKNLGYISELGEHKHLAHPTECIDEDLRIICQISFSENS